MGWSELILVGVVALIVVGPKDLPVMFQALGKMTAKVRRMAREFSSAMNDAADASGVNDLKKELGGVANPRSMGIDALKDAADAFDKWELTAATGPATAKLAEERAAAARKIQEATAKREADKRAAAAAAEAGEPVAQAEAPQAAAPDPAQLERAEATPIETPKDKPA